MPGILMYVAISVLIGFISCFFGKRLYFPILMLTVFTHVLTIMFSIFDISLKICLAAFTLGVTAALLSVVFYKLGVFLMGFVLGAGLGQFLSSIFLINEEWLYWVVVMAPALTLGLCALKCCQLFIMASTAYSGAVAVVTPLVFLAVKFRELASFIYADGMLSTMANLRDYLQGEFSAQYAVPLFAAALIMAVIGFLIQHRAEELR